MSNKKHYKILYLSEGYNVYDQRFLNKMVERGHKPLVLSYCSRDILKIDGVKTIHMPSLGRFVDRRHFRLLTRICIVNHLRHVIRKFKPDILHSGYIRFHGYYGALSGFHPTLSMPWGSDVLIRPDKTEYDMKILRYTLQYADMITCDCELVKNRIIELTGCPLEKIVVFPWGVDLTIYQPAKGPSSIREQLGWQKSGILIMNRSFEPIYGIEYFFEALPAVFRTCPDARILMIGKGSLEGKFRSMAQEMKLSDKVYFLGAVDDRTMAQCLNAADIYVTTSLSDGTSASMLEAMACGLPVVVSDAPAYFEWVQDGINGYIVPRKNSIMLAERLIELLQNPLLRREMGHYNLRIARERADWERNFDILEGIYEALLRKGRGKGR